MAYTSVLSAISQLSEVRTFTGEGVDPNNNKLLVNQLSTTETLNSSSTPAVTKSCTLALALSTGAITLDMTSMVDAVDGLTKTITGLTPAYIKFQNPSTNANPITIVFGGSNPYTGFGAAFGVTLKPGSEATYRVGSIVVDGSHKTFDLTGTGSQVLNIHILAG